MDDLGIGLELFIVLATAIAGGILARRLKLPVIVGYLAAGVAIGPHGFGLIADRDVIFTIANIGVVLLLFTIGLEFSLKEIKSLGKVALLGGLCQMGLTTGIILGISHWFGFPLMQATLFGIIIAESSTAVILKLCMERGETDSRHGRIMVSLSLVQDLSVVPLIVVMPALGGGETGMAAATPILLALAKAIGVLAVLLAIGWLVMPWVLGRITRLKSRELFLLFVVTVCFGTALATNYFGLSYAFGAFVAGLLINQSPFARQALADIIPLRDTFAALFFVALGMFFSFAFVIQNWRDIIILVPIVLVVKALVAGLVVWFFGSTFKTSLMTGLGLIPVGEFSFILAMVGLENDLFTEYQHALIVAMALITMLVSPFLLHAGAGFYKWISQRKLLFAFMDRRTDPYGNTEQLELSRHAVICGYGDVGRRLANVLQKQKLTYLVIDLDPGIINRLRAKGIPCIYGDASNPEILAHAGLEKARILICTIPDYVTEELVARNAKALNPRLDIVARVHRDEDAPALRDIGVSEIVMPFFEGSLEIIRHTLHKFGMSSTDIQYILNNLRQSQGVKKTEDDSSSGE